MKKNQFIENKKSFDPETFLHLRSIIDNSPEAVFIHDFEGNIIDVNEKAKQSLGYSKDEIKSMTIMDIDPAFPDLSVIQKEWEKISKQKSHTLYGTQKRKDGSSFPVEIHLSAYVVQSKKYMLAFVRDITEQKETDKALQQSYQMLETAEKVANMGSWQWIPEIDQVIYSDNALRLYGIKPEDYKGNTDTILKVIHPDDVEAYQKSMGKILFDDKPEIFKYRIFRPDGEVRSIEGTYKPNTNDPGKLTSLVGYIQDVTERTKQEKIVGARLRLVEFDNGYSVKEYLQKFLDEAELLTDSEVGFYHLLEADQETLSIQAWSTNSLKYMSTVNGEGLHHIVSEAGLWDDFVRGRRSVIYNNFTNHPHYKDLSAEHSPIYRIMLVPVFRRNKIVAMLGVGNKSSDYNSQDIELIEELAELAWEIVLRKKAEENTIKLSKAVEYSPESIIITDKYGKIEYVNPRFVELTGYSRKEAIGSQLSILNKKRVGREFYETVWAELQAGKIWQGEFQNTKKNGEEYWVNTSISPIKNETGEIVNFVVIKEDITEKKKILNELEEAKNKAEEGEILLKDAQRIAKIGNWELNLLENKLSWSDEIFRIFDCKPNEFRATYEAFLSFVHPDDRQQVNEAYSKHLNTKEPYNIIHRILLPENKIKYVNERCESEFDDHGSPIRSVGTVSDITENIQVQNELKKAKEKAEESDKLKTAFLNNMSHEIRTPMNAIIGFSDMLVKEKVSEEQKIEFSDLITRSSNQLLNVVNDILDIAEIEAGLVKIREEKADLSNFCLEVLDLYRFVAKSKNIQLKKCDKLSCPLGCVSVDRQKLVQILNNLLNNALKFTDEGSIKMDCSVKKNEIEFSVSDTGIGIDKKNHKRIFDRFRQAESSITRNFSGTGLGLSICKGLIEHMKGRIWLKSELGKGSTFFFTIPYKPVKNVLANSKIFEKEKVEDASKYKILVAEDEEINFLYISEILKSANFQFIHATNGKEAVNVFIKHKTVSLILMDIKMPVMNGYDATREIKKINPYIPIIAFTAHAFKEDKDKALKAGCDDYISKPVKENQLIEMINKHLTKERSIMHAL